MSTTINITIGDNRLIEISKLKQTANRQTQLEKEADTRVEAQATDARTKAKAAQGQDTNGNILTGTGVKLTQIDRRPIAVRLVDEYLLLRPDGPAVDNKFAAKSRGFPEFFTSNNVFANYTYEPTGGPVPTAPAIAVVSSSGNSLSISAAYPTVNTISKYKTEVQDFTGEFFVKFGSYDYTSLEQISVGFGVGNGGYFQFSSTFTYGAFQYQLYGKNIISMQYNNSKDGDYYEYYQEYWTGGGVDPGLPTNTPMSTNVWHHVAVCKKGQHIRFFIDGVLIDDTQVNWNAMVFDGSNANNFFLVYAGGTSAAPSYIHGFRFNPKGLYAAPFTPPTNF